MLGTPRRLAILAEGCFTPLDAKTAVGVLRYRTDEVAAIIDSTRVGRTAAACVGVGGDVPVVADVGTAASHGADSLMIGIAPQGGHLLPGWRLVIHEALARGWDVLSGLHVFLGDDPEFRELAERSGARLVDVRRPPQGLAVAAMRATTLDALVVLTVGSDCNVGKMTTALEIEGALKARSIRAEFVATGQTGIFIAGQGIAVDAVPADFVAGAVEGMVLRAGEQAEVVLVEGQGALHHPGYSGVTLSLLHGAAPQALVLCHQAVRDRIRITGEPSVERPIPPLAVLRQAYENAASWVRPARVVAASLNTWGLDESAARSACTRAAEELGVPATDPVRFGPQPLAEAIQGELRNRRAAGQLSRASR